MLVKASKAVKSYTICHRIRCAGQAFDLMSFGRRQPALSSSEPLLRRASQMLARVVATMAVVLQLLQTPGPASAIIGHRSSSFNLIHENDEPSPTIYDRDDPVTVQHRLAPNSILMDVEDVATREDHVFLHIPKTGGSSVEKQISEGGSEQVAPISVWARFPPFNGQYNHSCAQHGFLSPWHMTVEQADRCNLEPRLYDDKVLYCLVRDPVDRLLSELYWRKSYHERSKINDAFYDYSHFGMAMKDATPDEEMLTFANAVAFFVENLLRERIGSEGTAFTESILHLQPQAWYVFTDEGHQTCQKVGLVGHVRFGATVNRSAHHSQRITPALRKRLRDILWVAYKEDFRLVNDIERRITAAATHDEVDYGNDDNDDPPDELAA